MRVAGPVGSGFRFWLGARRDAGTGICSTRGFDMLAGRRNKRPVLSPRRRCKRSLICERVRGSVRRELVPLRAMVTAGEGNVPGGKELSDKVMTHTNRWRFLAAALVAFAAVNLSAQTRI